MDDKELQELDLEDIIREFKDYPEEEPEEQPAEEATPVTDDTVRVDLSKLPKGAYKGAEPVKEEEEPVQEYAPPPKKKAEPFTGQWEAKLEQPDSFIPATPIPFRPNNRLRELKRKLVNGPERRYYELTEKGTGRLHALIFIAFLVCLLCIGTTVVYEMGLVPEARRKLMVFGQLFAMLISALLGSYQLIDGLTGIFRAKFSLNTMLVFSFILCCVDGVACLQQQRVPCCGAFSLMVLMTLWDTSLRRKTEMRQMDTMRRATTLNTLRPATEKLDGRQVLIRHDGQVEDFMDSYDQPTAPEKVLKWYSLAAILASIGVGVTGYFLLGLWRGIQIAAVTLLVCAPASMFLCLSRPKALLQKRLSKLGAVICGWPGIRRFAKPLYVVVEHSDLFPSGNIKMNGVKFFGSRMPDEVIAYSAALIAADENGLYPLFEQLLESRNCHSLRAEELQYYPGGMGGLVRGEAVLVGTLSFLKEMGVAIPEGLRVSQALCVAIDGNLSGLFAISYERSRSIAAGFSTLCSYRRLTPLVTGGDLLMSNHFLRSRFGVKPKKLVLANRELRQALAELEPEEDAPVAVLSTRQDLTSLAFGVTGARALHTASYLGLVIHMVGGIVGIGIMLTLTLLGAVNLLTPLNVLLYQLVWSIPGLLITEWTRLL